MILALEASKIATHSCHGERGRPWKEMEEWLFFNGVHIERDRPAVNKGVKLSFPVLSHATEPSFRRRDDASMVAEGTLNLPTP
jgi:hypothetical protein